MGSAACRVHAIFKTVLLQPNTCSSYEPRLAPQHTLITQRKFICQSSYWENLASPREAILIQEAQWPDPDRGSGLKSSRCHSSPPLGTINYGSRASFIRRCSMTPFSRRVYSLADPPFCKCDYCRTRKDKACHTCLLNLSN
jgi:hypothetical protein